MPRAPLAAALVAALFIAPAASHDPSPCTIAALDREQQAVPTVPADSPTCRAALGLLPLYTRLTESAQRLLAELKAKPEGSAIQRFSAGQPPLKIFIDEGGANAYYSATAGSILVNPQFAAQFDAEQKGATWALAHELGHAVQHRTGTWRRWEDPPDFIRRYEAQADALAQQILARAGYSSRDELRAKETFLGCVAIASGEPGGPEYPDKRTRWINSLIIASALKKRGGEPTGGALRTAVGRVGAPAVDGRDAGLETLYDSARSAPAAPAPEVHAIRMSDFDARGAVNPRVLRPSQRASPPAPGKSSPAGPGGAGWAEQAAASWRAATDAIADVWDSWWFHPRLQAIAAKATGAPAVDTYGGAVLVGFSRTVRESAAAAAKAVWPTAGDAGN